MLERLYVHNFRCLENFELNLKDQPSSLLVGKSGSGKSSIGSVLERLQAIGRGTTQVRDLVSVGDMAWNRTDVPIVIEIEVALGEQRFQYRLVFEFPSELKEFRVAEESLLIDGLPFFRRERGQVSQVRRESEVAFTVDWHQVALPTLTPRTPNEPARAFLQWLAQMIVLAPVPSTMAGDSSRPDLFPERSAWNIGDWFSGICNRWPKAYGAIEGFLKELNPDLSEIENEPVGRDASSLNITFRHNERVLKIAFQRLSDGEKCFFLGAVALAATKMYGPVLCFWDEPDNHLTLTEVGHFVMALRRAATAGSQLLVASHHPEVIRQFSDENTLYLSRRGHLEPTRLRPVVDLVYSGNLLDALIGDEID